MTGLAEDLGGTVADSIPGTTLRQEDLPLRIFFEGKRYIIQATKFGGLVMTKEIVPVR